MSLQTIPLSALDAPRANPRRRMDKATLEGLAASIAHDGLLQNLVVAENDNERFEVVSGARRLQALSLLAERGDIESDFPVPVDIRADLARSDKHRLATIENIQREQLEPMDEAEAVAKLVRQGTTIDDIAAGTGLSLSTLKRRMAIAGLCKQAKTALRKGDISLSMAEALTLGDAEAQHSVLQQIEEQGWPCDGAGIRRILTQCKPTKDLAIFNPDHYTGTLTRDLFDEDSDTYFDDVEQFCALQDAAVQEQRATLAEQYAWVEVSQADHFPHYQYQTSKKAKQRGAIIHYGPSKRVTIYADLVKRVPVTEDESPADTTPKPKPDYTKTAQRYMADHKTMAVQATLLANPGKAREVAIVQMMTRATGIQTFPDKALPHHSESEPISLAMTHVEAEAYRLKALLQAALPQADESDVEYGAWYWLTNGEADPVALYEALKQLSDADLDALHSLLTLMTFGLMSAETDKRDGLFAAVARDLEITMRDWWMPDEAWLAMRSKDQLHAVALASGANYGRTLKDAKKPQLVQVIAEFFRLCASAEPDGTGTKLPPEIVMQGRNWCPSPMMFTPDE